MHAAPLSEARALRRPPMPARPRGPAPARPHSLRPETFRSAVEAELTRHNRYLVPMGLMRIGARVGVSPGLHEAVLTEVRRTDAACHLPDGSCALLLLHAGEKQLRVVARRLMGVAAGIDQARGSPPTALVAALLAVDGRRDEAGLLWLTLSRAYEGCKTGAAPLLVVP